MCKTSSLDEAKTVIIEIQINSTGSEFELDDNGHLRSNRMRELNITKFSTRNDNNTNVSSIKSKILSIRNGTSTTSHRSAIYAS